MAASQPILNFKSIYNTRSATVDRKAAALSAQDARDIVALVVTGLYLQATAPAPAVLKQPAHRVTAAQAVYDQAADFRKNGVVPAIEVPPCSGGIADRATAAAIISDQSDVDKLKLPPGPRDRLTRRAGIRPDRHLMPYSAVPSLKLEDAISRAYASRMDYQSAEARVTAAELLAQGGRSRAAYRPPHSTRQLWRYRPIPR